MSPLSAVTPVDQQMAYLVQVVWILLIPVGVLLALLLGKLVFLIHNVGEFVALARYDVHPTLQSLRETSANVNILSEKTVGLVDLIEKSAKSAGPILQNSSAKGLAILAELLGGVSGKLGELGKSTASLGGKTAILAGKLLWKWLTK